MHPEVARLRSLPVAEKLRIVEELWDDIGESGEQIPLPAWHLEEAQRRADQLSADPSIGLTEDELWRRVDGQDRVASERG